MTTSLSPSVGSSAASAGRSMPGMVRSASFDIAISAPVLPDDTAAPASPVFTAWMARPMEDFLDLRSAWLGLSVAATLRFHWLKSPEKIYSAYLSSIAGLRTAVSPP